VQTAARVADDRSHSTRKQSRPGGAEKLGLVRAINLDDHLLTYVSSWHEPEAVDGPDVRV
jgi:hypothetical protein